MTTGGSKHYDETYFLWQTDIGEFEGWANVIMFKDYLNADFSVIDFGCGGGYLLKNLICKNKIGIEINEAARHKAEEMGIKVYSKISEVDDNWADLII